MPRIGRAAPDSLAHIGGDEDIVYLSLVFTALGKWRCLQVFGWTGEDPRRSEVDLPGVVGVKGTLPAVRAGKVPFGR